MSPEPAEKLPADPVSEAEIDEVIAECGGAREAVRALLHDMTMLMVDADQAMSRGFLRGKFSDGARRQADDEGL
ncbi:MAG: hypothetical protein ACK4VM_00700 [Bosea sp. (in: a-proteobacteria)]